MTTEQARQCAKKKLSPKRYRHTKNVAQCARCLALRFGADADKAELAGWLHDIVKEESRETLLQLLEQDGIMAGATAQRPLPIWHGPCGAIYAKYALGIHDEELFSAMGCHTTGKKGMSLLDKVLFLADAISEERNYDCVEHIRKLAENSLDCAVIAAMEENIRYLKQKQKTLDADTIEALATLKCEQPEANFEPKQQQR